MPALPDPLKRLTYRIWERGAILGAEVEIYLFSLFSGGVRFLTFQGGGRRRFFACGCSNVLRGGMRVFVGDYNGCLTVTETSGSC